MTEKYTFLFAPVNGVGHLNACIGIAEQLRDRGHTIVFSIPTYWEGKLAAHGFYEELYEAISPPSNSDRTMDANGEHNSEISHNLSLALPPMVLHEKVTVSLYYALLSQCKYQHRRLTEIVNTVKPDVIVADYTFRVPALMDQGIPWILSFSCNPLGLSNINVPPAFLGLATDRNQENWMEYQNSLEHIYKNFYEDYRKWVIESGGPDLSFKFPLLCHDSPWANIYMCPSELDYTSLRPNPPNWYHFDAFVRKDEENFEIPEKLRGGEGKLIYFSMGTTGAADLELMKRLVKILSNSPNRFIVSKGPSADEFELSDNMWGQSSIPQTKVIPLVDLVITHGGNNTITESFYFGKRVLVLPVLWDQLDNGQRIHETGLGLQCHPYKVTEEELLQKIELLLGDELLERRMIAISKRIQSTNSQSAAADLVEKVAANNKKVV